MERFSKVAKIFSRPCCFFVIADTMQRRLIITSMLVERDLPKGVENLKLQIEIFVLEAKWQTNKNKARTKKDNKTLGQSEIMDYFVCLAEAHG